MSDPVSPGITQGMFFEAINQLRKDFAEAHARLRTDMTAGFGDLSSKLDAHAKDDQAVADRVLVMETERKGEQSQAMKRGTVAALLGAAGLTGAWEGFKRMAGW